VVVGKCFVQHDDTISDGFGGSGMVNPMFLYTKKWFEEPLQCFASKYVFNTVSNHLFLVSLPYEKYSPTSL